MFLIYFDDEKMLNDQRKIQYVDFNIYNTSEELEGMQLPGRVGGRVVHNPGQLLLARPPSVQ